MREDEPLESEVAVDPEMLGKVFESLLGVEERRERGTFYTPRWIVHYMCRESLIQYLDRSVNLHLEYVDAQPMLPGLPSKTQPTLPGLPAAGKVPRYTRRERVPLDDIAAFIRQDEQIAKAATPTECKKKADGYTAFSDKELPDSVKQHARELDDALAKVKVCDPAIGSGAFAVGMMHEIIHARRMLHEAKPNLFGEQPTLPATYDLKRYAIANSLYGVDIDISAVDIAKLRLWLSLVVDEDDYANIKPLPNLDYKIMACNSLDGLRYSMNDQNTLMNYQQFENLDKLRIEYLNTTDIGRKAELRRKISSARDQCGDIGSFDWHVDYTDVFFTKMGKKQHQGFDIVIGNPPYIQLQSMREQSRQFNGMYKSYSSMGDIYCLFYELGVNLLKKRGILAFITSNKWMRAGYGEKLRDFFAKDTNPLRLLDFAGHRVFDSATVDVNIMILEKLENQGQTEACVIKDDCANNLSVYIERNATASRFETGESWAILSPIEQSIKRKIEAVGVPLKDWGVKIYRGILTGYNEAFIISGEKKDELIAADPKSAEIIRPILRGRDIKRYGYNFGDLWLINTHNGIREKHIPPIDVNKYPAIKEHLDKFYDNLVKRQDKGVTAYNLRNCAYTDDFSKQKIVYPDIMRMPTKQENLNQYPYFYYDTKGFFPEATNFILTGEFADIIFIFLASDIGFYVFSKFYAGPQFDNTGFRYKKEYINTLYIQKLSSVMIDELRILFKDIKNFSYENIKNIDIASEKIFSDVLQLNKDEINTVKNYKNLLLLSR